MSIPSGASGYRLSPQQSRLWSLLGTSSGGAFHAQLALLLEGELDEEALRQALSDLGERHEILRTLYRPLPGTRTAVQVPEAPAPALSLAHMDGVDGAGLEGAGEAFLPRLEALLVEERARRASPGEAPAVRPTLVRLSAAAATAERHVLLLDLPALSADRRSLLLLAHLIGQAYAARRHGDAISTEGMQYADVAEVFGDLLESPDTEVGRRHWIEHLDIDAVQAALPGERRVSGDPGFAPRRVMKCIEAETQGALEAAARAVGAPLPVLVLTAWQVLLHRLSGRAAWSVAVAHDGRTYEGLEEALGLFERYLPLSVQPDEAWSRGAFDVLAREVTRALAETVEWQDYFDLGHTLAARGEAVAVPYLPLAFEAYRWPEPCDAAGLRLTTLVLVSSTERFDLKLACVERGGRLEVHLHYDAHRYTEVEVARLGERFERLLQAAAAAPRQAIAELPLIGAEEQSLLASFNQTARSWSTGSTGPTEPTERCIHELFEEQARRTPDRLAVVFGDERLSYAELSARSNRLGHHLRAAGVGAETRVGLCLERSVDLLVGILGILKAGGAYVPLDPMVPHERLAYVMTEAEVRIVVTQESLRSHLPVGEVPVRVVSLDGDGDGDGDAAAIARAPAVPPPAHTLPGHLAYVIFTSGSTGKPKGVMIEHRSAVNLAAALREAVYGLRAEPEGRDRGQGRDSGLRVSLNAPVAFDASVKQWLQLLDGHTLYVVPEEVRPDAAKLGAFVRQHGIEVLDCTPSQLVPLVRQSPLGQDAALSPALVLIGGEAIDERTWAELAARSRTTFVNVYGPTECTVDATSCAIERQPAESPKRSSEPGPGGPSMGRPLGNVRVHLLDRRLCPVPIGVVGEIYIGGAGVGRGYLGRPALTAERFVPDPFGPQPGARLYRTGDLGRWQSDGRVEFLGRADHQVKIRGYRIELGEIEAAIEEHPAVRQAVVVQREVSPGEAHLVAYMVLREGSGRRELELAGELRLWLRQRLPEYMVPWALVPLRALPMNANGKLDRAALPVPTAAVAGALAGDMPYEAPASEIERTVAAVWQAVLQVERVGLHHNFFDLGGHSLLMVQVHERLSAALGRRLSMVELFRHPTVAALARYLAGLATGQAAQTEGAETATQDTGLDERAQRQRRALATQAQRNKARRGNR